MDKIYGLGRDKVFLLKAILYSISIVLIYFLINISYDSLRNSVITIFGLIAVIYSIIPGEKRLFSLTSLWITTLFFTFIGSNVGAVGIGSFHMFPSRILLAVYWGIFILIVIKNKGKLFLEAHNVKGYLMFFVFWILWGILSFTWSASKIDSIRYAVFLIQGFSLILFSIYNFNKSSRIRMVFVFWVLLSFGLISIGLWENITFSHLPSSHVGIEYGYNLTNLNTPSSIFTNPNDFAYFICLSIPFILGYIVLNKNFFIRLICAGFVMLGFYLIIVTGSRSAMLGVIIQFGGVFILLLKKMKRKLSRSAQIGFFIALIVFLILLVVFSKHIPVLSGILDKLSNEIMSLKDKTNDDSISVRANLIKNGFLFLWNSFLMGVGAGNNEWYQLNRGIFPTMGIVNMHNWWVELLVNYGLIIFMLYIVFLFSIIRRLIIIFVRNDSSESKIYTGAILLSFLGFPIAAISSSSIFADPTMWMLYGTALSVINVFRLNEGGREAK